MGFRGATFGIEWLCKDGKMRQSAVNSRGKRQTNVHEPAEMRRHEFEQARVQGHCVSVIVSSSW